MTESALTVEAEQPSAEVTEEKPLPTDVERQIIFYFARDVLARWENGMTINPSDQLKLELRHFAVEHNVKIIAVYASLLRTLTLVLSADVLERLMRGPLQFLAPRSSTAE
jgi:hypothetical protein